MGAKQSQLNGANYGPSKSHSHTYHRPGHGDMYDCCCCCGLLSCVFNLLVTIIITLAIAAFVFWLLVRPNLLKFHVTQASLTQFNYTNSTLSYHLSLNITIRNPNRKIGVFYDHLQTNALYHSVLFDSVPLTPFYQGHKTTSVLTPLFSGHSPVLLDSQHLSQLNQDNTSGLYNIDLILYLKLRFKLGVVKTPKLSPKVKCHLLIPYTSQPHSNSAFQTTSCHIAY